MRSRCVPLPFLVVLCLCFGCDSIPSVPGTDVLVVVDLVTGLFSAGNSAPVIEEIQVGIAPVLAGDVISVNAVVTDSDSDPLTFFWTTTGGGFVASTSSNPTRWRAQEEGEYTLTVTVNDGAATARKSRDITVIR